MSQRIKYMLEVWPPCVILHEDYSTTLVLNKRKVFSHFTEFITFHQEHRRPASPLCLRLSSC